MLTHDALTELTEEARTYMHAAAACLEEQARLPRWRYLARMRLLRRADSLTKLAEAVVVRLESMFGNGRVR
jgi:hypothetical protein